MPGAELRPPRPRPCTGGPDGDQEALQQEARREEVEVRAVREEVRRQVGLEGAFEDVRDEGVQVRLRGRLLSVI